MNCADNFSNPLGKTSETFAETENINFTAKTRYSHPGKKWIKLIDIDHLKPGASRIEYAKNACFVVRDEEAFQVFDSICPHKAVNIPSDAIDGMILECPMHLWKFSLENGECIEKGTFTPLTKLKHKVENGILYLFV